MKLLHLLLATFILSCAQPSGNDASLLSPEAFQSMLQKDPSVQLIDVRTPEEFSRGHLENAINLNIHDADFTQKIGQLDKKKPVMVYCAVGGRSGTAAKQLRGMGFLNVYDLKGGINEWKEAGLPLKQ